MDNSINFFTLATGLLGGLALFLYGLDKMGNALKLVSGYKLKQIMTNLTRNRFLSLFTGTALTAMVQSSSATTVLLVGFVSAEMLTLNQALGVILGSGIGTTVTVQLIAFKVTKYALIPVALGFFIKALYKDEGMQNIGRTMLGLGLLFYGIDLMSISMYPLREHQPFIDIMSHLHNPIYAIIFGALFTAAVQSSAATLAIVVALASQGLIDLTPGIGLMLGANIGTCITAGLACIGKNKAAKRTATAHILFKVAGALLVLPFIAQFEQLLRYITPISENISAEVAITRDIANAHLIFNIFIALIFLPFTPQIAKLLHKIIPDGKEDTKMAVKYIDDDLLETPAVALSAARREAVRMGKYIEKMLNQTIPAIEDKNLKALNHINKQDEFIDFLYSQTSSFLIKLSKQELTETQSKELISLNQVVTDLESIGDLLERDIVDIGKKVINENIELKGELFDTIEKALMQIKQVFTLVIISIEDPNPEVILEVQNKKSYLKRLTNQVNNAKLNLDKQEFDKLKHYSICDDLMDTFTRIFYHSQKIAKTLQLKDFEKNNGK